MTGVWGVIGVFGELSSFGEEDLSSGDFSIIFSCSGVLVII